MDFPQLDSEKEDQAQQLNGTTERCISDCGTSTPPNSQMYDGAKIRDSVGQAYKYNMEWNVAYNSIIYS